MMDKEDDQLMGYYIRFKTYRIGI